MTGDIKTKVPLLKYPKAEMFNELSNEEIIKYIDNHKNHILKFNENNDYYIGKNAAIVNKKEVDQNNPDSRIAVSYARTQTQIVKGYMYKPNNIVYECEDQAYLDKLNQIFETNNEPLKTAELGEAQSKFGIGVELLYTDILKVENTTDPNLDQLLIDNGYVSNDMETIPYFCSVNPAEVVLVYSMNMYEKIIGAIRFYIIEEKDFEKKYKVEVYYKNRIDVYEMVDDASGKKQLTYLRSFENFYFDIPFCVYKNNNECHADYEPIKSLIDAYDILMSDSINEMQRFASAYLILNGLMVASETDGNELTQQMEKIKATRILQFMGEEGGAEFLTRDIPSEFFNTVKQTLREDIQYHSHIPDFRSKNFESASGVSLLYSLFDFENLCADKQSLFEVGLRRRLQLINNFLKLKAIDIAKVNIKFNRNLPININEKVLAFVQLAGTGKMSDEDLLKILPKEIIPDLEKALERIKKQKKEEMYAYFDLDNAQVEEQNIDETNNEENLNQGQVDENTEEI